MYVYVCSWVDIRFSSVCTRVRLCVYVEKQGGRAVCHLLIGRSSLGARETTSPSVFPFQTDLTPPAIKRKENFYVTQAPSCPIALCVPSD